MTSDFKQWLSYLNASSTIQLGDLTRIISKAQDPTIELHTNNMVIARVKCGPLLSLLSGTIIASGLKLYVIKLIKDK